MGEAPSIVSIPAVPAALPVSRSDDLVPVLLILTVILIIFCAIVMRILVRRELRKRHASEPGPFRGPRNFSASLFDAPNRWLAVRSQNPQAVQHALGVQNARACSWSDALATPFEPRLFIAPPVDGWVLVLGCDLPDPADDIDECFFFLTALSRRLGDVQFFTRHRALSHHGWVRVSGGKATRAYIWAGDTLWNHGAVTEFERELKMRCLNYSESPEVFGLAARELLSMNTEKVVRLAAAWSVDPTLIDGAALETKGIAGDLLHSKLH